jgi:hypothetical protein
VPFSDPVNKEYLPFGLALAALALTGCSRPAALASSESALRESSASPESAASDPPSPSATEGAVRTEKSPDPGVPKRAPRGITPAQAAEILFAADGAHPPRCDQKADAENIACLISARFASDAAAQNVALDLYRRTGDLAGLSPAETMEGGWRGTLHLVPALPTGKERRHLEWIAEATRDYDAFFSELTGSGATIIPYAWRGIAFRFMRSVGARTPSAYALLVAPEDGEAPSERDLQTIAYNLDGSLNKSADAVRELVFHENFHLNDQRHGDWSVHVLGPTFDSIVARCGTRMACLAPFTPTEMVVRGGTYYAFQPNNGAAVREYAAELALRYYREQRADAKSLQTAKHFKCGPKENASSWKLLVNEFFGGIDRTPTCP